MMHVRSDAVLSCLCFLVSDTLVRYQFGRYMTILFVEIFTTCDYIQDSALDFPLPLTGVALARPCLLVHSFASNALELIEVLEYTS